MAWIAAAGAANLGCEGQRKVLDQILRWLPGGAKVLWSADRFYPAVELFDGLHRPGWKYRRRLTGNLLVDAGQGDETTTGALAQGVTERDLPGVRLFLQGMPANLGILHEAGHPEPWSLAMDCPPTRAAVVEYGVRWGIEPMFSDVKGRGFEWEDSQREPADRLERLILIMALAMYWCVGVGRDEAVTHPTPLDKKSRRRPTRTLGAFESSRAAWSPGSNGGYAA